MSLDSQLRSRLVLPAVCAPMYRVSSPALVREACKGGLVGALPRQNARDLETFDAWLTEIGDALRVHLDAYPSARIGPVAVNLSRLPEDQMTDHLAVCRKHGVEIIISAMGDPTELIRRVHDWGGRVFHDVTTIRFAEKAIAAGADGLTCVGAGGGGHSGQISHLAFIPRVRAMFDGTIVMAGCVSNGAAIRAAEILGADLAYLGTRFIATEESNAAPEYKAMLVSQSARDLIFTPKVAGTAANWLKASLARVGLDPDKLPEPGPDGRRGPLPDGARPWATIWSAGQGIELIDDIPSAAELIFRLRREYVAACRTQDMSDIAGAEVDRLLDQAHEFKPG
jgi:nitronate monooxygenase